MKLLLIGWDAADWSLLHHLLDRGMMPRLQRLLSEAVTGEISAVRPFDSAALWTSLVTGKRAISHGVLSEVEVDPSGSRILPVSRRTLTARPVWSILSAADYRVQSFGWPATDPAEALNGVVVSDQFAEFGEARSIYPPRLAETLRALRLTPEEIDAASLITLMPRAGELNPIGDQRLYLIAKFLASTASLHAAATWALEHEPWDFAAVRYAGIARLAAVFGDAFVAAQSGRRTEDAELFGELLPNACRFLDMLLGRLVELVGPNASVMLVSPQGRAAPSSAAHADRARPTPGVFIGSGPAFERRGQLPAASVCDVMPTILDLFGLSLEPGSHDSARRDVLRQTYFQSGQNRGGNVSGVQPEPPTQELQQSPPDDDDSVTHLLSLGYRVRPDEFLRIAIGQLERTRQCHLAEAWIDEGDYVRAAQVLEGLVQSEPGSQQYRSMLAEVQFRSGEHDACRQIILALQADGLDTALGRIALAALDFLDGAGDPVEHLRLAEAKSEATPRMLVMIGRLYLGLRRRADAARTLDAALTLEPALASAHVARAIVYLVTRDPSSAEKSARAAVELNPQSYEAQLQLGLALAGQDRTDDAISALKAAVALDPSRGSAAHGRLADLLERQGQHALALHHRAINDRRGRPARDKLFDLDSFSDGWWQ
ncbi:MAG: alkaline phosphatase family protein [Pirellulales bacterium]|nr:alkaline phosphatase family protein [Pirellulales bacterium]